MVYIGFYFNSNFLDEISITATLKAFTTIIMFINVRIKAFHLISLHIFCLICNFGPKETVPKMYQN